jgi:hypothetical protein
MLATRDMGINTAARANRPVTPKKRRRIARALVLVIAEGVTTGPPSLIWDYNASLLVIFANVGYDCDVFRSRLLRAGQIQEAFQRMSNTLNKSSSVVSPKKSGRIMKRLAFLLLVIVIVVGVGFYRGWFTVNPEKIEEDEKRAKEEVRELLKEVKAKSAEGTHQEKRNDELPKPTSAPE